MWNSWRTSQSLVGVVCPWPSGTGAAIQHRQFWYGQDEKEKGGGPKMVEEKDRRPLSHPQIHQKIIWMLNNFHKTISEHLQRTPGTQKSSPIYSKGGRTKYKRWKQTKDLGTETRPGKGVVKEKFPHCRKAFHRCVCGEFWDLSGQHNRTGAYPTEYAPNHNYKQRWRSGTDTLFHQQQVGAGLGGTGCIIGPYGKARAWMPWGQSEEANVR